MSEPMEEEVKEAIQHLKQGDINGLEPLVRRYQLKALRVAYLIVRDHQLAEDIVEEAFLRAFDRIHQFDSSRAFEPWFLKIVINMARRAAVRYGRQTRLLDEDPQVLSTRGPNLNIRALETDAEYADALQALWIALGMLDVDQRVVLIQRYYLGLSESEIACRTQSPLGTIKWRLHAARKFLRRLLQADL
jgi:RNA polymerase sigma-70 factor (ECF subfamily)